MWHAIVCWLKSGDWKPSFDGTAAIIAGVIGFIAIIRQTRSSERSVRTQLEAERANLQEQLDAEKSARAEESERQKKAVATALLFEIDDFYRGFLRDPRERLARIDPQRDDLPAIASIGPNLFPVYHGNANRVGELDVEDVEAIVHFFGVADSMVSRFQDYAASFQQAAQVKGTIANDYDVKTKRALASYESLARTQLRQMKEALPELIKLTYLVCEKLCRIANIPFRFPRVAVAAENLSAEDD